MTLAASSQQPQPQPPPPPPEFVDAYIGYAPMADFDTGDDIWVRRGALRIDGDEISLHTGPLTCRRKKVFASESDGGFFEYKGRLSGPPDARIATLHYAGCDYCSRDVDATPETYTLGFRILEEGSVELGGIRMSRRNPPFPEHCPTLAPESLLPPELPDDTTQSP